MSFRAKQKICLGENYNIIKISPYGQITKWIPVFYYKGWSE